MSKKKRLVVISLIVLALVAAEIFWLLKPKKIPEPIKVGILHSKTGPLALTETPLIDAALYAIEDINDSGGLLGRKVEPVIADGKSDPVIFAQEAERLITKEKVVAIFGCWSSSSRKMVKNVVEKHNILLFYSAQFEGLELSKNIVYLGATANQQSIPAVLWSLQNLGNKFYLIGNNSIFQKMTSVIVHDLLKARREGQVVGEAQVPYGEENFKDIIEDIHSKKPTVILSTLSGRTSGFFSKELRKAGLSPEKLPTMSLTITETELNRIEGHGMIGDYGSQNYFQSLETEANKNFVERFKKRAGEQPISNYMENVFVAFRFFKHAVLRSNSTETDAMREQLFERALSTAEGVVSIDRSTQYSWKPVLIGKIFPNHQFGIVWNSVSTIQPVPFPPLFSQEEWEKLVGELYATWGNNWR